MVDLRGKAVLVAGMGKSGIAATEALIQAGATVTVYDGKEAYAMKENFLEYLKRHKISSSFGKEPDDLKEYDLVVLSPGFPLDLPFIKRIKKENIEIIGELELAYILGRGTYVAITGTNGKTTTTALTGEIFAAAGRKSHVVGNIGTPVVTKAFDCTEDTWLVTEVSSFQLETIDKFKPAISALLNLTPDHLNRHKTMEEYGRVKALIYKNQNKTDYFIVNYDDELSLKLAQNCKSIVVPFSRKKELQFGAFIKNGKVIIKDAKGESHIICNIDEIKILGNHNIENVLAASAICFFSGISKDIIGKTIKAFGGVAHRLEIFKEINGVRFINDSKGTNPDASIKAIEAMIGNVTLIAGGYDKDSDFTDFIKAFDGKVNHLILMGATAEKIKETALRLGYDNIVMAKDMETCVKEAYRLAEKGSTVLLSPASASWDMYTCFEERGEHFKRCVEKLKL